MSTRYTVFSIVKVGVRVRLGDQKEKYSEVALLTVAVLYESLS